MAKLKFKNGSDWIVFDNDDAIVNIDKNPIEYSQGLRTNLLYRYEGTLYYWNGEKVIELASNKVEIINDVFDENAKDKIDNNSFVIINMDNDSDNSSIIDPLLYIDSQLSTTSENPVQNKVIAKALNATKENIGDISTALDEIEQIQNDLLDGDISVNIMAQKKFEHICTVTVVSNTDGTLPNSVVISADDNGNSFELTDFYIEFKIGVIGDNKKISVFAKGWIFNNVDVGFTDEFRNWFVTYVSFGENAGGLAYAPDGSMGVNANGNLPFPSPNTSSIKAQAFPAGKDYICNNIKISVPSSSTFLKDSTIKLWGVRK